MCRQDQKRENVQDKEAHLQIRGAVHGSDLLGQRMKICLVSPAGGVNSGAYVLNVPSDMCVNTLNRRVDIVDMAVYALRKRFICLLLRDMRNSNIAADLFAIEVQPARNIRQANLYRESYEYILDHSSPERECYLDTMGSSIHGGESALEPGSTLVLHAARCKL